MEKKVRKKVSPPKRSVSKKDTGKKPLAPHKLTMLVTVVPRKKAEYYTDLIQSFECNMQLGVSSFGTSGAFGLGYDIEKQTIFSVIREDRATEVLATLEEKFSTIRGGKGLAFTVPLSSVVGVSVYQFLSNKQ